MRIEFDESNVEFENALDIVECTDKLLYVTGKAGTGKTTLLKFLHKHTTREVVIVAPTGVAAVNAGGQTIHSFFEIDFSVYEPNDKRLRVDADADDSDKSTIHDYFKYSKSKLKIIQNMGLLIIDEVSMVRCDLLDVVDKLLRVFRKKLNEPFGGVQVVLIGDIFQLPPVITQNVSDVLSKFYESPFYFFNAKVLEANKPIYIELKKIYRQHEPEFIELLNAVRVGEITDEQLLRLNSKYNPRFTPKNNDRYLTLVTSNRQVDETNRRKLQELKTPVHTFEAEIDGTFTDSPTNTTLNLKVGAQIMFVRNDEWKRFYNGKMGTIIGIEEDIIEVALENESEPIEIERETWKNIRYTWDETEKRINEDVIGTFTQFPVRLAWAITVHKSQGLTFERVIADLANAKGYGQTYVALSRCRTFDGLVLKSRIDRSAIKTDDAVVSFTQNETPENILREEIRLGMKECKMKRTKETAVLVEMQYIEHYDALLAEGRRQKQREVSNDEEWDW